MSKTIAKPYTYLHGDERCDNCGVTLKILGIELAVELDAVFNFPWDDEYKLFMWDKRFEERYFNSTYLYCGYCLSLIEPKPKIIDSKNILKKKLKKLYPWSSSDRFHI